MKKLLLSSVLSLLIILFFAKIQSSLLDFNFSWTGSFLMPYILLFLTGLALAFSLKNKLRKLAKALRFLILLLVFALPLGIGFVLNPIYEGDLSEGGKPVSVKNQSDEFKALDVVVITIPGCPFCMQSTSRMNLLQKRNPKLRIKYLVCSTIPKATGELKSLLNAGIKVSLAKDPKKMFDLAEGKFPSFVYIKKNQAVSKWTNSSLGTRALDRIESGDF